MKTDTQKLILVFVCVGLGLVSCQQTIEQLEGIQPTQSPPAFNPPFSEDNSVATQSPSISPAPAQPDPQPTVAPAPAEPFSSLITNISLQLPINTEVRVRLHNDHSPLIGQLVELNTLDRHVRLYPRQEQPIPLEAIEEIEFVSQEEVTSQDEPDWTYLYSCKIVLEELLSNFQTIDERTMMLAHQFNEEEQLEFSECPGEYGYKIQELKFGGLPGSEMAVIVTIVPVTD